MGKATCIHCEHEMSGEVPDHRHPCPGCGKPILVRGRTALGQFMYFQGSFAGGVDRPIAPSDWTADELETIAKDIRIREANGDLKFPDGSGSDKAGRGVT